ncbi:MAG: rhodanese-like domain-containing protein [Ginsengibacter sp.]
MQSLFIHRKSKILSTKIITFIGCVCFFSAKAQQPFRFDNVLYKAVYWNDAVRLMKEKQNYLLLDVRTPGEYADTSAHTHMNMGRLKGAVNINIDSFPQHLDELKKYRDKNIFVYCSHSQRSRRVSKLLADNGFKSVYNINGGMSVANENGAKTFPLKSTVLVNGNLYKNIASTDALDLMQKNEVIIIDIRSQAEFSSKDSVFGRNLGHIKNAVNLPSGEFTQRFKVLNIPKEKTILIYDQNGSASSDIASEVVKMGYTHVFNLFEGLEGFINDNYLSVATVKNMIVNPPPFNVVSIKECINLLSKPNNFIIIDARPAEEYNNKSSKEYLNTGRIKNAVNVSDVSALAPVIGNVNKDGNILIYGSYSGNTDIDICKALIEKGYKNVYFLYQGIGRFTWACFNIENCKEGINLLTDHKGLY